MLKAELDSNKSLKPSFSILVIIFSRLLDFEIIEHIYIKLTLLVENISLCRMKESISEHIEPYFQFYQSYQ